jgi:protein-S-isoprenylcysteine O-methyltransferase Ste14
MKPTAIIIVWLLVQAAAIAAWWGLILLIPDSIELFQPQRWPRESLLGFWLSDLLLVIGSLIVASGLFQHKPWSANALWSLAFVTWYPTLYCLAVSLITDEAWLATASMITMSGLTTSMATIRGKEDDSPAAYRVARMAALPALAWTSLQVLIFWGSFLYVIPKGIVEIERHLQLAVFQFSGQKPLGIGVFTIASGLGLWSGITMAIAGKGTPLPTATAAELVCSGPYRWIRNPMATAGILQGLAVGIGFGSLCILLYALLGGLIWQLLVRPSEEQDLLERFGEPYLRYRTSTGLWLPFLFRRS